MDPDPLNKSLKSLKKYTIFLILVDFFVEIFHDFGLFFATLIRFRIQFVKRFQIRLTKIKQIQIRNTSLRYTRDVIRRTTERISAGYNKQTFVNQLFMRSLIFMPIIYSHVFWNTSSPISITFFSLIKTYKVSCSH